MERTKDKNVAQLCSNIELYVGRNMRTPKDFEYLSEIILIRTHLYVSSTTLKRMWGYLNETTRTRTSTLDVLSKFLGYQDWTDFDKTHTKFNPNFQEGPIDKEYIEFTNLNIGEVLEVEWMPNSRCDLEYMGEKAFKVLSSINSKLKFGDIVNCFYIIKGESLYFIDSIIDGKKYDIYNIGKTGGVTFRIIE